MYTQTLVCSIDREQSAACVGPEGAVRLPGDLPGRGGHPRAAHRHGNDKVYFRVPNIGNKLEWIGIKFSFD